MNDLLKQVAKPQPDSTKVCSPYSLEALKNSRYAYNVNNCPSCNGLKNRKSSLCRRCRTLSAKPPALETVFIIEGEACRKIPLTQDQYALVDASEYTRIMQLFWCAAWSEQTGTYYAISHDKIDHSTLRLHRFILDAPAGVEYDHKNQNTLDNRRSNLRPCSQTQNMFNRRLVQKNNSSGYRGVAKSRDGWIARVGYKGKQVYVGTFKDPKKAAVERDKIALLLGGEFARLNSPIK